MPDEKQHKRIRLKVAVLDVRSANWSVFSPKPFADARLTTSPRRRAVDQRQVEGLKQLAYEAAVAELIQNHTQLTLAGHRGLWLLESIPRLRAFGLRC